MLIVKADGTWEYMIDRPSQFHRVGKWSTSSGKAWPAGLSFEHFEFGFKYDKLRTQDFGLWIPKFSRAHSGEVRKLCTFRSGWQLFCFIRCEKQSQT